MCMYRTCLCVSIFQAVLTDNYYYSVATFLDVYTSKRDIFLKNCMRQEARVRRCLTGSAQWMPLHFAAFLLGCNQLGGLLQQQQLYQVLTTIYKTSSISNIILSSTTHEQAYTHIERGFENRSIVSGGGSARGEKVCLLESPLVARPILCQKMLQTWFLYLLDQRFIPVPMMPLSTLVPVTTKIS